MRMALCSKTLDFSRQRIPPINTRLRFLTLLLFKFGTNMQLVYTSIPQIVKVPVYNQIVKTLHLNLAADAWDKLNNSK